MYFLVMSGHTPKNSTVTYAGTSKSPFDRAGLYRSFVYFWILLKMANFF